MHIAIRAIGFIVAQALTAAAAILVYTHRWLLNDLYQPVALGALASLAIFIGVLFWLYKKSGKDKHVEINEVRLRVTVAIIVGMATLWLLDHAFHKKAVYIIIAVVVELALAAWVLLDRATLNGGKKKSARRQTS